jgi:hypothetical protein
MVTQIQDVSRPAEVRGYNLYYINCVFIKFFLKKSLYFRPYQNSSVNLSINDKGGEKVGFNLDNYKGRFLK